MSTKNLCLLTLWCIVGTAIVILTLPVFAAGVLWCATENIFHNGYKAFDKFTDWNP